MMPSPVRSVVFMGALAAALVGAADDARACERVDTNEPVPFHMSLDRPKGDAPKNAGLVFQAWDASDVDARVAETKITVRAGEREIEGTLRRKDAGSAEFPARRWLWLPSEDAGMLPPGKLHVEIASADGVTLLDEVDVTVADRTIAPPTTPPAVELRRELGPDEASPKIQCSYMGDSAECTEGLQELEVASRVKAMPVLGFMAPEIDDATFFEERAELFGRNADGSKSESVVWSTVGTSGGGYSFGGDGVYDEYCAKFSVRLLASDEVSEQELCVPRGTLDLTTTDKEQQDSLDERLSRCESIVYPPEMNADGTSDAGGCSVTTRGIGAAEGAGLVLLGGVMALVGRRRKAGSRDA